VTELGTTTGVSAEQFINNNTSKPIVVIELGKTIDIRFLHPANAPSPISVTEFGIITYFVIAE